MAESQSSSYRFVSNIFRSLARRYVARKKPIVIAVAGSVGKTSTKLMLAHVLRSKKVSVMDDSYNNGLGLYLSVFQLKIPTKLTSPLAWGWRLLRALGTFAMPAPEILIIEYGIDHPGDMDEMIGFIQPTISLLTAVTPEHMEYMKTLDGVADEETKILRAATQYAVYNSDDVAARYVPQDVPTLYGYGSHHELAACYRIESWEKDGAVVTFQIDTITISDVKVKFIAEPLIRQLTGAALIAHLQGVPKELLREQLETATPAASRMRVFDGINDTVIIDDTTNFSPDAGIEALRALKRLPAERHIAVLGNMHELGEYADQGYGDVAKEFEGIDILVLVGDLSPERFGSLAREAGFIEDETLFIYPTSVDAGIALRDKVRPSDAIIVKGPFGGFYLEEAVKKLLKHPRDARYLTRQSRFWQAKKRKIFGDRYTE